MPSLPIERGKPGPGLLAHVLVSKYADHLPLYRQAEIYAREGVDLERSTLADWVGRSAALLDPLVAALRRSVLSSDVLHGDDTPVPVLAPGLGKTRTGRLWTYVRDGRPCGSPQQPAAVFFYSSDRKGEHPRAHLKGFTGILHADGYAGFNPVFETGRVTGAACWRMSGASSSTSMQPTRHRSPPRRSTALEHSMASRTPSGGCHPMSEDASVERRPHRFWRHRGRGSTQPCQSSRPSQISPRPCVIPSAAELLSIAMSVTATLRSTTTLPNVPSAG